MAQSNKLNLAITVNGQEVETTLANLNKSFYKLRNSVNKLDEGTEEWLQANKELAKVERERERQIQVQKEYREEIRKTIDVQEDSVKVLGDFGSSASYAFESLRTGDMVAFQSNWKKVTENIGSAGKALLAFISTPIGAFLAALGVIAAVTTKFIAYNKEIAESVRLTEQLTGFDGKELSQYRAAVQATAETFDKEFNEVLRSANSLAQQMGISQQEALDLINQGFIRGADLSGDFLKKLEEYPVQFKNAGYSAQDFIDVVTQEAKGGIYDDKLIDAIKEADLALKEMTITQQEALKNAFGQKFADEIAKGVASGRLTTEDAINRIIEKSNELGLNLQQKQQLVADVFKGAGEDAGGFEVIIEQLNKAFDEQNKKLDENEVATQRLVDANTEYEQALADLFDASQSGFPAMLTNLQAIYSEIKSGILVGLKEIFTSLEELQKQAGIQGKDKAIKRIYDNVIQYGTDAATEANILAENTQKNIERIHKIIDNYPINKLGKLQYEKELASAEGFLTELTDIAKGKSEEYTAYVKKITTVTTDSGNGKAGQSEEEKKAAEERQKKAEEEAKKALAEEEKRLSALQKLQEDYDQRTTARVEQNAVDTAERLKAEALAKAESLGATFELLEEITAEHDLKIQEAKKAKEDQDVADLESFEARKQALLDELELAKAESDAEKEAIKEELDIAKEEAFAEKETQDFENELERLQIQGEEKQQLLQRLEEIQGLRLQAVRDKYRKKESDQQQKALQYKLDALDAGLDAAISIAGQESEVGKALFFLKKALAIAEIGIQASKVIQEISLNAASATGSIAKGAAETASVGYPQNIIMLIGYAIQAAAIIASFAKAKSAARKAKSSSFATGGYTDAFGQGYSDATGHEVAGVVHTNEYVVPSFVRKDPEVPQILQYLESKRKRKLGLYAQGGDTIADFDVEKSQYNNSIYNYLIDAINRLNKKLDEPFVTETYYGVEAEVKRQEVQKKLDRIKKNSKIK